MYLKEIEKSCTDYIDNKSLARIEQCFNVLRGIKDKDSKLLDCACPSNFVEDVINLCETEDIASSIKKCWEKEAIKQCKKCWEKALGVTLS